MFPLAARLTDGVQAEINLVTSYDLTRGQTVSSLHSYLLYIIIMFKNWLASNEKDVVEPERLFTSVTDGLKKLYAYVEGRERE